MHSPQHIDYLVKIKYPQYSKEMYAFIAVKQRTKVPADYSFTDDFVSEFIIRFAVAIKKILINDIIVDASENIDPVRAFLIGIACYRNELTHLSPDEFEKLYQKEKRARQKRVDKTGRALDNLQFFSGPSADANFETWATYPAWTVEEAVALTFGKDPTIVNTASLKRKRTKLYSPFIRDYQKRKELVSRSITAGHLHEPLSPCAFLEWACDAGIECPSELVHLVQPRLTDWEARCYELEEEVACLQSKLDRDAAELAPKSKRSLFRMIIAMAVASALTPT